MALLNYKSLMPSFLTVAFELMEHWKRDSAHNSNIKKLDKTTDKLGTIENMLVRLEKKIQTNREMVEKLKVMLLASVSVNLLLLILILLKVFAII
jgi:hypothetical protein